MLPSLLSRGLNMQEKPLWSPDPASLAKLPISRFMREASRRAGETFADYDGLHAWSIAEPADFWGLVWDFCGVVGEKGARKIAPADSMRETLFFPEARLNFAENLIGNGDHGAIVFRDENRIERRMTRDELRQLVSCLQQAMLALGIGAGDRVAAMLPNMPETIAFMLAAASIGATFSS